MIKLKETMAVLMVQDLFEVQNIILTHLSDRNSDEEKFVDEVKALTEK